MQLWTTNDNTLVVEAPLVGPQFKQLAQISVKVDRNITLRSKQATAVARYLSICIAIAVMLVMLLMLQRMVIGRVAAIRQHTNRIAEEGLDVPSLTTGGRDEIGQLAKAFDRMKKRLGDAQMQLSLNSRAAGMTMVAETVIHNVGNVLTNVNSLIETVTQRIGRLRVQSLDKLAERLRDAPHDSELQRATPDYLKKLSKSLHDDQADLAQLLETLSENIQHIDQVIRDQRRHANPVNQLESVAIFPLVQEAVRCCEARLEKDEINIEIVNAVDAQVHTDRSVLLQVLINVIGNARNAMQEAGQPNPLLKIDLIRTANMIHVRFRDNGCGMSPMTLRRIFDAHFTTRQTGTGLGLHFCALALKRLGGAIHAHSEGVGLGATFVIEIPLAHHNIQAAKSSPLLISLGGNSFPNIDPSDVTI